MDETQIKLADKDVMQHASFLAVALLSWLVIILVGAGIVVAGVVGLFDAVRNGPEVWNISLAVLGAALVLRFIVSGAVRILKRDKVKS